MRHFLLHRYFGSCGSRECRRPTVDLGTIVMCVVDLGVTKESKMELGVVCDLSAPAMRLLCCPRNPLTTRAWLFIAFWFARTTCAQSRGTRTLVRRDTSDKYTHSASVSYYMLPRLSCQHSSGFCCISCTMPWVCNRCIVRRLYHI